VRAELAAAFFCLYGIERDDIDYIMEMFSIVKRGDEELHSEYRTKRLILQSYEAMATAVEFGEPRLLSSGLLNAGKPEQTRGKGRSGGFGMKPAVRRPRGLLSVSREFVSAYWEHELSALNSKRDSRPSHRP
jgi:hypothetical protein